MNSGELSKISSQNLVGRAIRLPLRLIPKRLVVRVRSGINKGFRWIAGSSTHGCWLGHYEADKQTLVQRLVKPGMRVFDIGANAGFYTLAYSRLVGKEGHVYAFEPLAENVNNLLQHIQLNKIKNVTLIQSAVSDKNGIVGFNIDPHNTQGAISEAVHDYLVPTLTLDQIMEQGTVQVPDVVKMDVEGAESMVLAGAQQLIAQGRTTFLIALHSDEQMRRCVGRLAAAGYAVFCLDGQSVAANSPLTDEIYATPPESGRPQ